MSFYHITLQVTTVQEEAIVILFKERCWEYLKTGQEHQPTEFSKCHLEETYKDGHPAFPLPTACSNKHEGNMSEEDSYSRVKTEVVSSHDNKTAVCEESRETVALTDTTVIDSIDVSHTAAHINTLQRDDEDNNICHYEALELPSNSSTQNIKTFSGKVNRTKWERYQNGKIDNTGPLRRSRRLITKIKEIKHDQKDNKVGEEMKTSQKTLEAGHTQKAVTRKKEEANTSDETTGQAEQSSLELKVYKCDICNKRYEIPGRLVRHMIVHSEAGDKTYRHECAKCGESFIRKKQLAKHMADHNREDQSRYKCGTCGKLYTRKQQLKIHVEALHGEKGRFICEICGKLFTFAYSLKLHMSWRTCAKLLTCEVCNKSFPRPQSLKKHKSIHTGMKHVCATCGKTYSDHSNLRRHMFEHSNTVFKCDFCERTFKTPYALKNHVVVHTKEKRHICYICGEAFGRHSGLRLHIMKHTGDKPYTCDTCGKSFPTSSRLRKHGFVHEPEKLHRCQFCKNVFWRADNLRKHMLIHTEGTIQKC